MLDPGCAKPNAADIHAWPHCASPFWISGDKATVLLAAVSGKQHVALSPLIQNGEAQCGQSWMSAALGLAQPGSSIAQSPSASFGATEAAAARSPAGRRMVVRPSAASCAESFGAGAQCGQQCDNEDPAQQAVPPADANISCAALLCSSK